MILNFKSFHENTTYISTDKIGVGSRVRYETISPGHTIVGGHRKANKNHNTGTIVNKVSPTQNLSPYYIIKNDVGGKLDKVFCSGSILEII